MVPCNVVSAWEKSDKEGNTRHPKSLARASMRATRGLILYQHQQIFNCFFMGFWKNGDRHLTILGFAKSLIFRCLSPFFRTFPFSVLRASHRITSNCNENSQNGQIHTLYLRTLTAPFLRFGDNQSRLPSQLMSAGVLIFDRLCDKHHRCIRHPQGLMEAFKRIPF